MVHNTNTKTICLILPCLQAGGMERVMTRLANYFVTIKHISVHLVLFNTDRNRFYHVDSKVNVHEKINSKTNKIAQFFDTILFIRKTINTIKPDAILSFGTHWNNLVLLSLKGTDFNIFVSDRGSPLRKYGFVPRMSRKIFYHWSRGIIAQSKTAQQMVQKAFPSIPVVTIGNPIDLNPVKLSEIKKENIILSVGRLINSKHHDRMINIIDKMKLTNWRLVIVGGDSLKQNNFEKLKQLIQDKNLKDKVNLTGYNKQVQLYYEKSRIFIFTSSIEGFPNVIGEALSAGLPVVSYDCVAGPSEMITDGENGFLVPVFDDELFRRRLQTLIDDEKLRDEMGRKARESMKKFSVETIGQQYLDFILS